MSSVSDTDQADVTSPTPEIDALIQRVAAAVKGEDGEKILANLYGPMVRRLVALEDLLVFVVNNSRYPNPEIFRSVDLGMTTLGFTRTTTGEGWVKSTSGL
jgi:hypothetical protein